jgi:MauM/NapG family ferredoxin protein
MNGTQWRRARQFSQIASTALFFLLAALTYRGAEGLLPADLFFRLDPLLGVAAALAARTLLTTFWLALGMFAASFVFGRVWCGWFCPLGALLAWFSPRAPRKKEPHPQWRKFKYALLVIILTAALLGNLTLLILDPLTLLNRTFAVAFVPALNVVLVSVEAVLYPFAPAQFLIDALENSFRGTVLPAQQTYYELGAVFAVLLGGIVALNWVASRFWCRYLCPLGALYALPARVAWVKPHAVTDCNHCAACLRACPTGAIAIQQDGLHVDTAECVMCMDCVAVCPQSIVQFKRGASPAAAPAPALSRREALGSLALGVTAVALFAGAPAARRVYAFAIRPPGAVPDFLSQCIRCGECVRVCPTGGLQAASAETGIANLWTPNLVPRLGYCDFSCNACGQVCPTGAISLLSLAQKRAQVIGTAYLDTNRCLPYAAATPCIVCEEMCPLSPKAISLTQAQVIKANGERVTLQRPVLDPSRCIGCGICEYQCPQTGPAAIRVYVPTKTN